MKIFYDTEFIETGPNHPIDLISVGMVAEDGRELYAVSAEFDQRKLLANPWLRDNVWPSLPTLPAGQPFGGGLHVATHPQGCRCVKSMHGHFDNTHGVLDLDHPDVRPRAQIARAVAAFILETPDVELWAWYGAYDHVVLCQLWGRMVDLPRGVPMFTHDLKQEAARLGNPPLPQQVQGRHNALADARHLKTMAEYLATTHKEGQQ